MWPAILAIRTQALQVGLCLLRCGVKLLRSQPVGNRLVLRTADLRFERPELAQASLKVRELHLGNLDGGLLLPTNSRNPRRNRSLRVLRPARRSAQAPAREASVQSAETGAEAATTIPQGVAFREIRLRLRPPTPQAAAPTARDQCLAPCSKPPRPEIKR